MFDGVSSAKKIDSIPLYSFMLAQKMKQYVSDKGITVEDMTAAVMEAEDFVDVGATGTRTDVVGSVGEDRVLRCVNLGD